MKYPYQVCKETLVKMLDLLTYGRLYDDKQLVAALKVLLPANDEARSILDNIEE